MIVPSPKQPQVVLARKTAILGQRLGQGCSDRRADKNAQSPPLSGSIASSRNPWPKDCDHLQNSECRGG